MWFTTPQPDSSDPRVRATATPLSREAECFNLCPKDDGREQPRTEVSEYEMPVVCIMVSEPFERVCIVILNPLSAAHYGLQRSRFLRLAPQMTPMHTVFTHTPICTKSRKPL